MIKKYIIISVCVALLGIISISIIYLGTNKSDPLLKTEIERLKENERIFSIFRDDNNYLNETYVSVAINSMGCLIEEEESLSFIGSRWKRNTDSPELIKIIMKCSNIIESLELLDKYNFYYQEVSVDFKNSLLELYIRIKEAI